MSTSRTSSSTTLAEGARLIGGICEHQASARSLTAAEYQDYSSLDLGDVYAVVTFYVRHREEVDEYLERRQAQRDKVRRQNEARFDYRDLRQRLLARLAAAR